MDHDKEDTPTEFNITELDTEKITSSGRPMAVDREFGGIYFVPLSPFGHHCLPWGRLWRPLGSLWGALGADFVHFGVHLAPFGVPLGPTLCTLGSTWLPLGCPWVALGRLGLLRGIFYHFVENGTFNSE